jgi:hypothetical protein
MLPAASYLAPAPVIWFVHRLMIGYGAWSSLAHAFTMTIMSAQAIVHGTHRQDSPQDIVMFVVIGGLLLALLPAKQTSPTGAS